MNGGIKVSITQFERDWIVRQCKKNKDAIEHELRLLKAKEMSDELIAQDRALEEYQKCVAWDKAIAISDRLLKQQR